MPLVATRTLLDAAMDAHAGVAAFNVITLEHAEAIAAGDVDRVRAVLGARGAPN